MRAKFATETTLVQGLGEGHMSYGERIGRSAFFARLLEKARGYLQDPAKLRALVERATSKGAGHEGQFKGIWASILALFRLLRAYWRAEYRDVPTQSLMLMIAGLLYFVAPIDLIPDFLLGIGYLDDAAVLAWILSQVRTVLDDFLRWEKAQQRTT